MGLIAWFQRLLGLRLERDVSRQGDDRVVEVVDTSGGPLKPHHRRRALRDRRLLPKPRTVASTLRHSAGIRRPKVMSADQADRLFSATMRTRNRALRDLATDEEQLRRLGLPLWRDEAEL